VVGKYEQGRVTHVTSPTAFGDLSELEKQQVTWVPKSRGGRMPSPNDIDALVWAVKALETKVKFTSSMASQSATLKKLKRTNPVPMAASAPTTRLPGPRGRKVVSWPVAVRNRAS
jgi:hypothetical protein